MKNKRIEVLSSVALPLLLGSCAGDLLVGERRCYGEGVDCRSDAPTIAPPPVVANLFDVVVSRSVEPVWIYDAPVEFPWVAQPQLAPAPDGGVWTHRFTDTSEMERLNAAGEPVERHVLNYAGVLSVNDELSPILLYSLASGQVVQTLLGPFGNVVERAIGDDPIIPFDGSVRARFLCPGPEGRIRAVMFTARGSHLAEYTPLGELLWRQPDLRVAREFPFEARSTGTAPAVSYQAVTLSDGSIALGVPKDVRSSARAAPGFGGLGGLAATNQAQGITLVESDGNVRWDILLGTPSSFMRLAPGADGSVIYTTGSEDTLEVVLIEGDGNVMGRWMGQRAGFHGVAAKAICSDAAGDVYMLVLTGERRTPVPTVCRMHGSDPSADVECLGVESVVPFADDPLANTLQPTLTAMTSPEPGAVVFSLERNNGATEMATSRLVRVEF